jgi:hypothetical protein
MNPLIKSHTERCIECYGQPIEGSLSEPVDRESHEQMRADLMIAVGMLMALNVGPQP